MGDQQRGWLVRPLDRVNLFYPLRQQIENDDKEVNVFWTV
jgi:hypothetical protein